ncbi:MAG: hypothetical protein ACREA3_02270 [Nitrosotalea sp.]
MNKKKALAELIEMYKLRITQLENDLKAENLSNEQRNTLESCKKLATEDLAKIET